MPKKSNLYARFLRSRNYFLKVVRSKKLYNRKQERINTLKAAAKNDK